jgi:hypothetical protein
MPLLCMDTDSHKGLPQEIYVVHLTRLEYNR